MADLNDFHASITDKRDKNRQLEWYKLLKAMEADIGKFEVFTKEKWEKKLHSLIFCKGIPDRFRWITWKHLVYLAKPNQENNLGKDERFENFKPDDPELYS